MAYLIFKALHLIAMVCWFAALFYLPRLYVYHAMAQDDGDETTMRRFCVMERKLYIMGHIGMGMTLFFGALLLYAGGWAFMKGQGWLHAKLLLVAGLVAYQIYCGRINRTFATGLNRRSHKFYRFFNEIPSLALIAIVLLASLKPF
ncbi:MAG: protoporphyrinogen oxidase HemJ [Cardiobacteriaceae bacterium]|nr:protoporphyrinogen oxidase HemJ [Cardiobacteriaceae bacterium]